MFQKTQSGHHVTLAFSCARTVLAYIAVWESTSAVSSLSNWITGTMIWSKYVHSSSVVPLKINFRNCIQEAPYGCSIISPYIDGTNNSSHSHFMLVQNHIFPEAGEKTDVKNLNFSAEIHNQIGNNMQKQFHIKFESFTSIQCLE